MPNWVGVMFGAKATPSEAPVRAAAERRPPGRGHSGEKTREAQTELSWFLGRRGMTFSWPLRAVAFRPLSNVLVCVVIYVWEQHKSSGSQSHWPSARGIRISGSVRCNRFAGLAGSSGKLRLDKV